MSDFSDQAADVLKSHGYEIHSKGQNTHGHVTLWHHPKEGSRVYIQHGGKGLRQHAGWEHHKAEYVKSLKDRETKRASGAVVSEPSKEEQESYLKKHKEKYGHLPEDNGSDVHSLHKYLSAYHGSQHAEQETNMTQEFKPTTDRQRALLEDLNRFTAKQKQLSTIQFSERDKEYFTTNIKTIIDRLQETVDKPIEYNAEKGIVQFKEGETTQHVEAHEGIHEALRKYGYQLHHASHGYGGVNIYHHPKLAHAAIVKGPVMQHYSGQLGGEHTVHRGEEAVRTHLASIHQKSQK